MRSKGVEASSSLAFSRVIVRCDDETEDKSSKGTDNWAAGEKRSELRSGIIVARRASWRLMRSCRESRRAFASSGPRMRRAKDSLNAQDALSPSWAESQI